MVKVIFCDLDDTLLQPKTKEITYQDQQSIKRWLDSGHLFVLATARHHSFLNNISDKFHEFDFDCIGWNGAEIYMNHKVTKLYPFSSYELEALYQKLKSYQAMLKVTNIENMYIFGVIDSYAYHLFNSEIKHQCIYPYSINEYLRNKNKPIVHVNYIFQTAQQAQYFIKDYQQLFKEDFLQCKVTSPTSFDLTMPNATKEKGIQAYLEYNNIPITDAAVIGDSQNDIGMMQLVQKSFCMQHGHPKAKKVAYKVVCSVSEAIECLEGDEK